MVYIAIEDFVTTLTIEVGRHALPAKSCVRHFCR